MNAETPPPLSGRRAEAARNDERIVEAARAVFLADPGAPIAAVAERAGVGIASLYRRYPSKEALLERLFLESFQRGLVETEASLAEDGDAWEVFCRYMHRRLDAGDGALSLNIAVNFAITDEMRRTIRTAHERMTRLVERTQAAGALRRDVEVGDIGWIFVPIQAIESGDPLRNRELRHRHLAILLDGLHASSAAPLPGPPPGWDEFGELWEQVIPRPVRG